MRILVDDDNTTNQQVPLAVLEKFGYREDIAANGADTLAALNRAPYDLVFIDCQMPGIDGSRPPLNASNWAHAITSPSPSNSMSCWRW